VLREGPGARRGRALQNVADAKLWVLLSGPFVVFHTERPGKSLRPSQKRGRVGGFCRKMCGLVTKARGAQKNLKNRDSMLTRSGKSSIVPPAIRLLHISPLNLINKHRRQERKRNARLRASSSKSFRAAFEPIAPGSDRSPMPPWDPSLPGFFIAGLPYPPWAD